MVTVVREMAKSVPSIECKRCGGSALYNYERGSYQCSTCHKARQPKTLEPDTTPSSASPPKTDSRKLPLDELDRRFGDKAHSPADIALVACQGCGAQVEVASSASLSECPFCDRKVASNPSTSTIALHEPQVLPFRIDEQEAAHRMREHLDELWLRPGSVRAAARPPEIRKVFVPFWAFSVQVNTHWSGSIPVWKEPGCLGSLMGQEARLERESLSGERNQLVSDWLVCASHGVDSKIVAALEPFSTDQPADKSSSLVLGQTPVEVAGRSPSAAWMEAQRQIRKWEYQQSCLQALQGRDENQKSGLALTGKVRFGAPVGRSVLLPLYILSLRTPWGRAQVVVNGENGNVAARVPYSWPKAVPAGLAGAGVTGLILVASAGTAIPFLAGLAGCGWVWQRRQQKRNEATFLSSSET